MSDHNAIPSYVTDDALEIALQEVERARHPHLNEDDIWAYGLRRVDHWVAVLAKRYGYLTP